MPSSDIQCLTSLQLSLWCKSWWLSFCQGIGCLRVLSICFQQDWKLGCLYTCMSLKIRWSLKDNSSIYLVQYWSKTQDKECKYWMTFDRIQLCRNTSIRWWTHFHLDNFHRQRFHSHCSLSRLVQLCRWCTCSCRSQHCSRCCWRLAKWQ